ncbi:MAG: hypothetical protein Q9M30_01220 [Mariprofundaceae bacterium]|nr:hypothetical protein [Mariprofundaceae bacterium]
MKTLMMFAMLMVVGMTPVSAYAVTKAEDIATTIMLRGQPCGGNAVSGISEQKDAAGNTVIKATCPNGKRYRVDVSASGRVSVTPIQ